MRFLRRTLQSILLNTEFNYERYFKKINLKELATILLSFAKGEFKEIKIPFNCTNAQTFKGCNVFNLWNFVKANGLNSYGFLTFGQIQKIGKLKKGSHGVKVVFFSTFEKTEINADGEAITATAPILKQYYEYNIQDVILNNGASVFELYAPKNSIDVQTFQNDMLKYIKAYQFLNKFNKSEKAFFEKYYKNKEFSSLFFKLSYMLSQKLENFSNVKTCSDTEIKLIKELIKQDALNAYHLTNTAFKFALDYYEFAHKQQYKPNLQLKHYDQVADVEILPLENLEAVKNNSDNIIDCDVLICEQNKIDIKDGQAKKTTKRKYSSKKNKIIDVVTTEQTQTSLF